LEDECNQQKVVVVVKSFLQGDEDSVAADFVWEGDFHVDAVLILMSTDS